jgi:hypothetical protein
MGTAGILLAWAKKQFNAGGQNDAGRAVSIALCTAMAAAFLWLSCGIAPASAAGQPETVAAAQTLAVAQYSCDDGCGDRPSSRPRAPKLDREGIPLELVLKWSLVINVVLFVALIILSIAVARITSRGPTIDLSNLKLTGKLDGDAK